MPLQMQGPDHKNIQSHKRFPSVHNIIAGIVVIVAVIIAAAAIFIVQNQGINQGLLTLTIISIVVGMVIGLLTLMVNFFQWLSDKPSIANNLFDRSHLSTRSSVVGQTAIAFNSLVISSHKQATSIKTKPSDAFRFDWGEAALLGSFYGREKELIELESWIVYEHCRMITVLGIGGVGKTALVTKLAEQLKGEFDYIFWRSLQNALPLDNVLVKSILLFSDQQRVDLPKDLEDQITILIGYLRDHRCLLVLDNLDTILQGGNYAGNFREGYEDYGRLLKRIGETGHQSCLLLTSREKPKEVVPLEGETSPVRSLQLLGLGQLEGQKILKDQGLFGTDDVYANLINLYSGNPLALKLVSEPIREVFEGNVAEFLKEEEAVVSDIYDLLDQQFRRISGLEREIMYWLAVEREATSLDTLREDNVHQMSKRTLLGSLDSLRRRSMIESGATAKFTLQPVIMEYVTDRLIDQMSQEINMETIDLFGSHALIKAQAKDYVRNSQIRLILKPLAQRLLITIGVENAKKKLNRILSTLRETDSKQSIYAAGNMLNLLIQLNGNLRGSDFSHLTVWQAYLQGVALPDVNFAYANFAKSVFTETFGNSLSVAFSPSGKQLAAGTANGEIRLWEASDGTPILTYQGHKDWIWSIVFSPDGKLLATGSSDQTVRLWEVKTGQCLRTLHGHTSWIRSVVFSPDGALLASGSEDQTVRLWEVDTGQCFKILRGHTSRVWSVAFSPNNGILSSSDDQTVRLWEVKTGQCLRTLHGHTSWIRSVAFSSDGALLASGSEDQTVRLWEVDTGQCFKTLPGHMHSAGSWVGSVAFSPDSQLLASSEDLIMRLWEVSTGQCLKILQGHTNRIRSVVFSPDGMFLASGSEDQTVRLWEVSTGQCLKTLQGHTHRVWSIAFSPDGTLLVSGSEDPAVQVWEVNTGRCLKILQGHTNRIRSVAFSPDGMLLASGSEDQTVRLWEVSTGRCLKTLQGHTNRVRSVTFSSDGMLLASGSEDQIVRLWEVSTGQCLKILQGDAHRVRAVAFSPDGTFLASGNEDQTVRLWEVSTGQCLKILRGHTSRVWSVAFSPDGNLLANSSEDEVVRVWEVSDGQCIRMLQGHTKQVRAVAFNPNGSSLASASNDGTIKLWDIQTGTCLQTLRSNRPYEHMNITGVKGLTEAQKFSLKVLGAFEKEE